MKKDHIFKKSVFGGFNRKDVLQYIDEIKKETVAEKEVSKALVEKCDALTSTIDGLETEISNANSRETKLLNDLSDKTDEIIALEKKIAELEGKIETLEENSEKYKMVESQVGSMIVDARCYSDKVIENAKEKVGEISAEYCEIADDISKEIDDMSGDLHSVSDKVSSVINTVVDKLSKLTNHLKSAEKLLLKSSDDYGKQADEVKNVTIDSVSQPVPENEVINSENADSNNVFEFHQLSDAEYDNFTNEYKQETVEKHFEIGFSSNDSADYFPQVSAYSTYNAGSTYHGFIN
ncbi:MAG: hypothetical protein K5917_04885 [Clostridiales bacterium]|nr:hypothetical protein [Clostridiales bacterium]